MRLIVIGRDPQQASIVVNSQYISNYHAEIILLDNGDMFLVDKSTNGTFLNGVKLTPGKEVAVKRGDNIMFADVPLDWNQIDPVRVPRDVKAIMGIGSHYMNSINVQGPKVSRFHATIRQMSDNKWYICDHSKNGTTVNNVRIQKDRFVQLKKGDEIACAGVPVQNPIPSGGGFSFKWLILVAAVACVTALALFIPRFMKWSPEKIARTYSPSVAWVVTSYHFHASCPGLDLKKFERYGLYTDFVVVVENDGLSVKDYYKVGPMYAQGTGFFLGEEGYVVTNRHVSRPWEDSPALFTSYPSTLNLKTFIDEAKALYRSGILFEAMDDEDIEVLAHLSQLEITGVVDGTLIIPHGSEFDSSNTISCREVIVSPKDEDLAIFKIRNANLPSNITPIPLNKLSVKEMETAETIYTLGFPRGLTYQNFEDEPLQVYFSSGQISNLHSVYEYGVTALSYNGASGSPVFDEYGDVVAIIHSGYKDTQGYNYAIKSKYLVNLLNQANITK
jgi:pSer/pThr/pTyr-binding forkhead associated (FHA) protein